MKNFLILVLLCTMKTIVESQIDINELKCLSMCEKVKK